MGLDDPRWILGICAGLTASAGSATGLVLQKLAHNENDVATPRSKIETSGGLLCSWKWIAGLVLLIVIPIPLDLVAVSLAPQSVVMPLAGASIVFAQV